MAALKEAAIFVSLNRLLMVKSLLEAATNNQ
jgi:hypothetical protein